MRLIPLLIALTTVACGPKAPTATMLEAAPKLPAPRAPAYATARTVPSDPVIARIVEEKAWNESLSGAAAGLALGWSAGSGSLSGWEVREAAWQAGWAWPIQEVRGWITGQGDPPPDDLMAWLEGIGPDQDIGLVRARGRNGDAWVALRSTPRGPTLPRPRQVEVGDALAFSPQPGVELTIADPSGVVTTMDLGSERVVHADLPGEWLVETRDEKGVISLYPVYAGLVPPEATVLATVDHPSSDEDAEKTFARILTDVRATYGRKPYSNDPLLDAATTSMGSGRAATRAADVARNLGYRPETTWKISCRGRTLTECADHVLWNPRARSALLATDADAGIVATLTGDGVSVVVLVAAR